jgi:hypothetical protein
VLRYPFYTFFNECIIFPALAQDEDDENTVQKLSMGLNFNTNGGIIGGAIFKYSQALSASMYQTFGIEVVNVKTPKSCG